MDYNFKYSEILPPLTKDEYQALKLDIQERGILVPIVVDENSNVIDGQHRLMIADELGLKASEVQIKFEVSLTDEEKQQLAIDLNLHRRHMSRSQRDGWIARLSENENLSTRLIAEMVGTSQRTVSRALHENGGEAIASPHKVKGKDGKQYPAKKKPVYGTSADQKKVKGIADKANEKPENQYLLDELDETGNIKRGNNEKNRLNKLEKRQENTIDVPDNDSVWHGDFRKIGQKIPDNSVDLIFTDPPYNESAIKLYRDLGVFAKRVLKPGGLCLAYSGQVFLPNAIKVLSETLEYVWIFAIKHNGAYTRIFKTHVNNAWKPILMFCKSPYEAWWQQIIDLIEDKIHKDDHDWQQSNNAPDYYLERLCPQNGFIVDPFCGSGTTLVSAQSLGLKYIGIEIDEYYIKTASKRLLDDSQA